ncbi:hypothetical protein QQP08_011808 [Theobroma cacao]|nr:hypothetical protein QQP08_011808 [Theobroma cacao]
MEKPLATLERGTTCSAWNYCGERLAAGSVDGSLSILDSLLQVAAYSDGFVKIFELLDPLELKNWQLQAEYQNVIAVASQKGIAIWHVGSTPDLDGRLSVEKAALLSEHNSEVWQMEWDMSGMTLATTESNGPVRLWQSNLNGAWHEQAAFEPTS